MHALWQQCVAAGVEFAEEWYVTDLVLADDGKQTSGIDALANEMQRQGLITLQDDEKIGIRLVK